MNENQGAKGGKQDRKRVFKIKQFYIEKIKELNKNEKFKKKLKKKKLLELQLLIPVLLKLFLPKEKTTKKEKSSIKKEEKKKETTSNKEEKPKEKIVTVTERVKVDKKPKKTKKKDILEDIVLITLPVPVALLNDKKDIKVSNKKIIDNIQNNTIQVLNPSIKDQSNKPSSKEETKPKDEITNNDEELEILEVLDIDQSNKEISDSNKELEKYKASRIVSLYEDKFKEIRLDLKNLFYEYSLIEEKYDHVKEKSDADDILKRLDILIDKVKELKSKLDIPNSDKYENSYIYQLVEEYVNEFNNNKAVSSIKSSDLYIDISNKIKELEQEKDHLKKKTLQKKELLSIDEEKMKQIKKEKEKKEKYNEKLNEFTKKADEDLEKINKKINEVKHKNTEITLKISQANSISNNLLLLIGAEMMIPTANSAKKVAVASTVGLYLLNKLLRRDKYKKLIKDEISTVDYSKEIEASLTSISQTISKLDENIYDIDKMIFMLQNDYSDYKDNNEFKGLLNNLFSIKKNIEEKKDNLIKIQKEEEKNLNKNNNKVKVLEENM